MADGWEKIPEPKGKDKPKGDPQSTGYTKIGEATIDKVRQKCEIWVTLSLKPTGRGKDVWESCSKCDGEHVHRPKDSDGVYDSDGNKIGFVAQFDGASGIELPKPWHVTGNDERGIHKAKFYQGCSQTKTQIQRCVNEVLSTSTGKWSETSIPEWSKKVVTTAYGPSVIWESEQIKGCDDTWPQLAVLPGFDRHADIALASALTAMLSTVGSDVSSVVLRPSDGWTDAAAAFADAEGASIAIEPSARSDAAFLVVRRTPPDAAAAQEVGRLPLTRALGTLSFGAWQTAKAARRGRGG